MTLAGGIRESSPILQMANRLEISDEEWGVIYPILATHKHVRVRCEKQCRSFLVAVLWILRGGMPWRMLPETLGRWNSIFKRFARWCGYGVWDAVHAGCMHLPDLKAVFIDSTVNRAHPCAAGAAQSDAESEALGRSRGGFSTKVHAITDALGNPLEFVLTGGQASDIAIHAQEIIKARERIARAIARETGKAFAEVMSDIERDRWLNASEAVDYGLVGRVIEHKSELKR